MCGSVIKKVLSPVTGLLGMDAPGAPKAPEPPPPAPTEVDAGVTQARDDERRRRAAAAGAGSTILTGAAGLNTTAQTGQKTLLGA